MSIHLFSASRVAEQLHLKQIAARDRGYYLVASFLIFTVFYYSGLVNANPLWSWLSFYEAVVITLITIVGLSKNYAAAGGDSNQDFIAEFTCLYVPVSVTTFPIVWGVHWGVVYGFRELLISLSESHLQIAHNLSRIGADFFGLITFLAVVLTQAITFYRINNLLAQVHPDDQEG